MIKKILIINVFMLLLIYSNSTAQITSSPYTLFGAGRIEDNGFGVNKALGGTGIAFQSKKSLNNINPASYSAIDSLSFLFEAGVFGKFTVYNTASERQQRFDGNLRYLAMGLRLTKWWAGSAGIVPYSSVHYYIQTSEQIAGELTNYIKTFTGEGGINQFYLSNALKPFKNLSFGINASYIFGSITQKESMNASDNFEGYLISKTNYLHNYYFDFGIQYSIWHKKWKYTTGIIYGNSKNLKTTSDYVLIFNDDTTALDYKKKYFTIPAMYGIGICIENELFRVGFDYKRRDWQGIKFANPQLSIRNSERFSFGAEFRISNDYKVAGYKRFYYRLGLNHEKSYLIINKKAINSRALTLGIGIPIRNELSMVNISFETGVNGTISKGLIRENYYMLHFNLTLHDLWFQKSKYY
jgi:hypothetical protein